MLVLIVALLANYGDGLPEQSVAAANDVPPPIPAAEPREPVREAELADAPPGAEVPPDDDEPQPELEGELSAEEIFAAAAPAVVTISIKNDDGDVIGAGSGFFIENRYLADHYDGFEAVQVMNQTADHEHPYQIVYLLTNYHVIESAVDADVQLSNGVEGYIGDVLTEDVDADLALLEVWLRTDHAPQMLTLAESMPNVGASVYAIGSPQGLQNTLSTGLISGIRELEPDSQWLQTTAAISPGSSGGPLLNADGEVVGITTAFLSQGQNLNFASAISAIYKLLDAPFESRELWRGVSYDEEESDAYRACRLAIVDRALDAGEKAEDIEHPLWNANELYKKGRYILAIQIATDAVESVSEEFKYLAFLTIGKSHLQLAKKEANDKEWDGVDELYANFRSSPHSAPALEMLKKAVAANPDTSPGYAWLTKYHIAAGEWHEGLIAADIFTTLVPKCADAYLDRGWIWEKLERDGKALQDYQLAVELNPINGEAHYRLASTFVGLAQYQNGIQAYQTAIELQFTPYMCYYSIGNCYKKMGHYKKAIGFFERARENEERTESNSDVFEQWCKSEIAECQAFLR